MTALFTILAIIAVGLLVFAAMQFLYINEFEHNSKLAVAKFVCVKDGRAIVSFRHNKRYITAPANVFSSVAFLRNETLLIRFLPTDKAPSKWDIRIIANHSYGQINQSYGQRRMKIMAWATFGIAMALLILSVAMLVRR